MPRGSLQRIVRDFASEGIFFVSWVGFVSVVIHGAIPFTSRRSFTIKGVSYDQKAKPSPVPVPAGVR